jgi:stearoyl-CoA desaturase (delta-9 desaturase)
MYPSCIRRPFRSQTDIHSPRHRGFIFSHFGWIFARRNDATDLVKISDLARYPELMRLHKYEHVPLLVLALVCYAIGDWPGLVVGFFWSTVLVLSRDFLHQFAGPRPRPPTLRDH